MKALKPSMREKRRYLLLEGEDLKKNVEKSILDFIGVFGFSKTGLEFIKQRGNSAIICINREMVNQVRASFAVWSKKIEIKRVSGTLKSFRE
ncbi:MAG: Rpp14/Pop5 family protein [Nanoarchaeota archaeon]